MADKFNGAPTNIAGYDPTSDSEGYWYDPKTAEDNVDFYRDCLVHLDGEDAGKPFELQEWQKDIIRTIYGWKREDNGRRRYRTVFWFIPRKNGKTTIAAGMAKQAMYADGEPRARCYCTAESKEQAELLFDMVRDQVLQNKEFSALSKIRDSRKRILHKDRLFTAMAVGDSAGHGLNVHFCAYDEFHLFKGEKHKEMYNSMHTATGNRPQPLELIITTAGWGRESMCYEQYCIAKKVRDGDVIDATLLPIIYEAEDSDDWTDPEVWRKANPNIGVTISEDYIRRECERAKREPGYQNVFRRLHLNQWTSQESRWLPMDHWRACKVTEGELSPDFEQIGGLDLSAVADFTAWMRVQKTDAGIACRGHYFLPEEKAVEYERTNNLAIGQWVESGWLTLVPGSRIEHSYIHARIKKDADAYNLQTIGYDPWNMEQLRQSLEGEGFNMVKVRQGYGSLSGPAKELEGLVLTETLDHGNDPVLAWMADNAMCKSDENGNIRPVKGKGKDKIDGIVALIMAIHALQFAEPVLPSIFDTEWNL